MRNMASLSDQRCGFDDGKENIVLPLPVKICYSYLQRDTVSHQIRRNYQTSRAHAKSFNAHRVIATHMPEQARTEPHQVKEHSR